jgi:GPH family glycoside/pentoside/hexuronide:cation symporter
MWDAITDPIMGAISDNSRLKWGRRRPFIVIGSLLSAFAFPLIWMVSREWNQYVIFAWFMVTAIVYYTCYTIFSVPYLTLATEMSPDYHERTRIISARAFANKLVAIAVGWLFALVTLDCFKDELEGMRWVSLGISALFIVFGVIPAIFAKERFYRQASKQKKVSLIESFKITMRCRPFQLLMMIVVLMVAATMMVSQLGIYLGTYYVYNGDKAAAAKIIGWGQTVGMVISMISIPVFCYLSRKLGKIRALTINLIILLIATLSKWILVNPDHPWWMVINAALIGPGVTGVWLLLPSMQADICDYDEINTGARREGSYSSMMSWVNKMGLSVAMLVSGFILSATGFDVKLGGAQTESTFFWMRVLYCFVPTVMVLLTFVILKFYPLTEQRCYEIRTELEARRGKV